MFKEWPKIPRLENEKFHVSEKIDGTNACVIIQHILNDEEMPKAIESWIEDDGTSWGIWAQSRTRLIYPETDNYGFAKWVSENVDELKELGKGYHYGEWWGQGIQRHYGMDKKIFSLFHPLVKSEVTSNVPYIGEFDHMPTIDELKPIFKDGSLAAKGFMRVEGVVVWCQLTNKHYKVIFDK